MPTVFARCFTLHFPLSPLPLVLLLYCVLCRVSVTCKKVAEAPAVYAAYLLNVTTLGWPVQADGTRWPHMLGPCSDNSTFANMHGLDKCSPKLAPPGQPQPLGADELFWQPVRPFFFPLQCSLDFIKITLKRLAIFERSNCGSNSAKAAEHAPLK